MNVKKGWFSPTDVRLVPKRKLTKLKFDTKAWSKPSRYTPGVNTQDRLCASKEQSGSLERVYNEDLNRKETEITNRTESSRTSRDS